MGNSVPSQSSDSRLPAYWKEGVPRYNRRALWHDYRGRCFYMVTVSRNEMLNMPFCSIEEIGRDGKGKLLARVSLTEVGSIVFQQLYDMERHFEEVKLLDNVVMPDHIHAVIYVCKAFPLGLGAAINYFKGGCTRKLREVDSNFAQLEIGLFGNGYHDRIVKQNGMLDRLRNYVRENPSRYLVKRKYPQMFRSNHVLECRGRRWKIYGNFLLLKEPDMEPLIVSSRYTTEEKREWLRRWENTARSGGVLVSPFYSQEEKALRNAMIEQGASVIHLQAEGFPERFAPRGKYHSLCEEGRLLIIGEEVYSMKRFNLRREVALYLNDFARWLAGSEEKDWRILRI